MYYAYTGDLRMIDSVLSSPTFKPQNVVNDKGETLLHLTVKSHWDREVSTRVLATLTKSEILDPSQRDKCRKKPVDYLREPDRRITMLQDATFNFSQHKRQKSRKCKESNVSTDKTAAVSQLGPTAKVGSEQMWEKLELTQAKVENKDLSKLDSLSEEERTRKGQDGVTFVGINEVQEANSPKRSDSEVQKQKEPTGVRKDPAGTTFTKVNDCNQFESRSKEISEQNDSRVAYLKPNIDLSKNYSRLEYYMKQLVSKRMQCFHSETINNAAASHDDEVLEPVTPINEENLNTECANGRVESLTKVEDIKVGKKHVNPLEVYGLDFDKLPWEVEITAKVLKFFKDSKKIPFDVREAAAKTIYRLAEGRRNDHLSKIVGGRVSLQLFETRMTKDGRILWEKAISYSTRLTGHSASPVYTEVIRVWEIVLDHDNLSQRIKHCTRKIEESHILGFQTSVRWPLLPEKAPEPIEGVEKVRGREKSDVPRTFHLHTGSESTQYQFTPAASTKEHEYTLTTFYSFDTIACKSMLLGNKTRRDFPFKEWHKEHEIIQLPYTEPILLLGRSGTGKTTCCLYRLWNEFKNFWNPESDSFECKFPRRRRILPAVVTSSTNDAGSYTETASPADKKDITASFEILKPVDSATGLDKCSTSNNSHSSAETSTSSNSEDIEIIEEDLHQVFITKKQCAL